MLTGRRILWAAPLVSWSIAVTPGAETPTAIVGVKLMRTAPGASTEPFRVEFPSECGDCAVLEGPQYVGENGREIFFHVRVPVSTRSIPGLRVHVGGQSISAVIVEKNRIPFSTSGGAITFDMPVVPGHDLPRSKSRPAWRGQVSFCASNTRFPIAAPENMQRVSFPLCRERRRSIWNSACAKPYAI